MDIQLASGGSIALKTATQIATDMTTGLFAPLYSQVDPLHIGEAGRAMSISSHYGQRLLEHGQNIEQDELEFITSEYPSHGFVIDRQEADALFKNVREPTRAETLLAEKLGDQSRAPKHLTMRSTAQFEFLSTELPIVDREVTERKRGGDHDETIPGSVAEAGFGTFADETPEKLGGSDNEESPVAEPQVQ